MAETMQLNYTADMIQTERTREIPEWKKESLR